jgi:hypothetical protein
MRLNFPNKIIKRRIASSILLRATNEPPNWEWRFEDFFCILPLCHNVDWVLLGLFCWELVFIFLLSSPNCCWN